MAVTEGCRCQSSGIPRTTAKIAICQRATQRWCQPRWPAVVDRKRRCKGPLQHRQRCRGARIQHTVRHLGKIRFHDRQHNGGIDQLLGWLVSDEGHRLRLVACMAVFAGTYRHKYLMLCGPMLFESGAQLALCFLPQRSIGTGELAAMHQCAQLHERDMIVMGILLRLLPGPDAAVAGLPQGELEISLQQ